PEPPAGRRLREGSPRRHAAGRRGAGRGAGDRGHAARRGPADRRSIRHRARRPLRLLRARPERLRCGRDRRAALLRQPDRAEGRDPARGERLGRRVMPAPPAGDLDRVGFGGAPLGNLFAPIPEPDAVRAVTTAYDAGIRYFDTAPLYGRGRSERRIGAAFRGRPRDSYRISTKVGRLLRPAAGRPTDDAYTDIPALEVEYDYSEDGALRSLEESLERLGLDRVDTLFIHDIDRWTHGDAQPARFQEAMAGAYRALRRLRDQGVVSAIGVGVNEWEVCQQAAEAGDFDGFLLAGRYTLLEQAALESFLPLCERRGLFVVIGGPFNSG